MEAQPVFYKAPHLWCQSLLWLCSSFHCYRTNTNTVQMKSNAVFSPTGKHFSFPLAASFLTLSTICTSVYTAECICATVCVCVCVFHFSFFTNSRPMVPGQSSRCGFRLSGCGCQYSSPISNIVLLTDSGQLRDVMCFCAEQRLRIEYLIS